VPSTITAHFTPFVVVVVVVSKKVFGFAMGNAASANPQPPASTPVPNGKTRVCVAGFRISPYTGRARYLAAELAAQYPNEFETWFYFDSGSNFYAYIQKKFENVPFPPHLKGHCTSPMVWLERGATNDVEPLGGCNHMVEWIKKDQRLMANDKIAALTQSWFGWSDIFHNGKGAPQPTARL
jgi:hypothetical protein